MSDFFETIDTAGLGGPTKRAAPPEAEKWWPDPADAAGSTVQAEAVPTQAPAPQALPLKTPPYPAPPPVPSGPVPTQVEAEPAPQPAPQPMPAPQPIPRINFDRPPAYSSRKKSSRFGSGPLGSALSSYREVALWLYPSAIAFALLGRHENLPYLLILVNTVAVWFSFSRLDGKRLQVFVAAVMLASLTLTAPLLVGLFTGPIRLVGFLAFRPQSGWLSHMEAATTATTINWWLFSIPVFIASHA